jgi:hypothetical protein
MKGVKVCFKRASEHRADFGEIHKIYSQWNSSNASMNDMLLEAVLQNTPASSEIAEVSGG